MSIEKHKNYVEEMMVTFSKGTVDGEGNEIPVVAAEPAPEGPQEPAYTAIDVFNNSVNDLIKDFNPSGEMDHIQTVDTLSPEESQTEMEVEDNQIGFEYIDGKLHISIDGNDIYLSPDAIAALKDYLNNMEESDDESESDAEEESDESTEEESDDSNESDDSDSSEEDNK